MKLTIVAAVLLGLVLTPALAQLQVDGLPVGQVGQIGQAEPLGPIEPVGPLGSIEPVGPLGQIGSVGSLGQIGSVGPVGQIEPVGPLGQVEPVGEIGTVAGLGLGPVSLSPFRRVYGIGAGRQILTINNPALLATIEGRLAGNLWRTIWNYRTGYIATRLPQGVCYLSTMNRNLFPSFNQIALLADENKALKGEGALARAIRYSISRTLVRNLLGYGQEIYSLCNGLPTYLAYELEGPQGLYNQGACNRLNILRLLGLEYCQAAKL